MPARAQRSSEVEARRAEELRAALNQGPLAVDPRWLDDVREAIAANDYVRLHALTFGWGSAVRSVDVDRGVGLITIRGMLIESTAWQDYTDISQAVESLGERGDVNAIVMDINSPGGTVSDPLWDLAGTMREVRAKKPITAVANTQTTSAAYIVAAQANKILAGGPSTILGSLGVIAIHVDRSEMLKQMGYQITEVVSGAQKNALSVNRPLSREGRASLERLVAVAFDEMVRAITAGRSSLKEAPLRAQEGAIYVAEDALGAKLVDGIMSLSDVIERAAAAGGLGLAASAVTDDVRAGQPDAGNTTGPAGSIEEQEANTMADKDKPRGTTEAADPAGAAAQPASPEAGAGGAAAGADVISIDRARDEGTSAEAGRQKARIDAINQACRLAGCPERAGEFIGGEMSADEVGAKLLQERADADDTEIDSRHSAGASADVGPRLNASAIYKRRAREAGGEV